MLELEALTLQPGAQPISHRFDAGAITVVLGANRSGKTLLCRCLAGLASPVDGTMRLDGVDLRDLDPRRRPVALVNQAFVNYPAWNVADNIASPLIAKGAPRGERDRRVSEIAGKLGLVDLLTRHPHELSGGQQQRVAIGRALAKDARVLVLDEPLVNLDYKLREALRDEVRMLLLAEGLTVIYTTTDPIDAFAIGHTVMLFADHAVLQSGSALEVYRHPASFAAAALMSEPTVNAIRRGGVLRAVRPEHVRLVRPEDGALLDFRLDVHEVETNGAHTFIHGAVDNENWVVKLSGMASLPVATDIPVFVRERDLLSFAAA